MYRVADASGEPITNPSTQSKSREIGNLSRFPLPTPFSFSLSLSLSLFFFSRFVSFHPAMEAARKGSANRQEVLKPV